MNTEPTVAEALIVAVLGAVFVAYLYFRHRERRQRLDIVHQERLAAMEKGIPLPEFPLDPPKVPKPPNPNAPLLHGIAWVTLAAGAMVALRLMPQASEAAAVFWPLPLPLLLLGLGLLLYYVLASRRAR